MNSQLQCEFTVSQVLIHTKYVFTVTNLILKCDQGVKRGGISGRFIISPCESVGLKAVFLEKGVCFKLRFSI